MRNIINHIYDSENIPNPWLKGTIIRLYKNKGTKGKCSNERGITLSSNFGKLFERCINNRVVEEINISEAQGGGKKGTMTSDHILILNNTIHQYKRKRNTQLKITFLDVTKAYDKAWLNAILYTIHKSGIKGKNWRMIKNLNTGLTAKVKTKYGLTEDIHIKDSIRQGDVLSVVEYSNLIDEIAKEINNENTGKINIGNNETTGCLLWMDDIALIHTNTEELQKMLDTTHEMANRYHIKFGKEKSQTMTIGNNEPTVTLGEDTIDNTKTYKYLGLTLNNRGNMEDHIKAVKGKTEAALQTTLNIAGYHNFNQIKMEIIWKLFTASIIPIITYAAEAWIPTQNESTKLQQILDNALKRILNAPRTTPTENLILETGIWNIESLMAQKQLNYYHKLLTRTNVNTTLYKVAMDPDTAWNKQIKRIIEKYNIDTNNLSNMSKGMAKRYIKKQIHTELKQSIENSTNSKSK